MPSPLPFRALPRLPLPFLLGYLRARRYRFGFLGLVLVAAGSCSVAVQYGMKMIVDAMAAGGQAQRAAIWGALAFFLGLIALESLLWRLGGWLGCANIVATGVDMRVDMFRHLMGQPLHYFRRHLSGALGNRITATAQAATTVFSVVTWNVVPPCVDFVGALVVLILIDWHMALALAIFVTFVAIGIGCFGSRGKGLHQAYGEQASVVGGEIVDTVANVWAVQAFSARFRETARLAAGLQIEAMAQRRSWMYLEKARGLHDICLWLMAGSMLGWALFSWSDGRLSAGDVVVVSALAFRILHGSRDLALALVGVTQHVGVIGEMLQVMAGQGTQADIPGAMPLRARGEVVLREVSYSYPNGKQIFRKLSLSIPAGQKVGIVGASGAGKSTLLALLQRIDDVDGGVIMIDGMPIESISRKSLEDAISVVPQDVSLFRRSIMDNIRYGRADATDDEVYAAARQAHCEEFINALPQRYQTVVGERGASLSGGQRQRLGIARAILKNAPILLLDEATSSLDSHSEGLVNDALIQLMRDRTVVAAAHRLSTLSRYDRILVMADGEVVEDGPLHALREQGGLFSALWQLQTFDGPVATASTERQELTRRDVPPGH
jgi:ATP-binding cassette subfamily B protein